MRPPDPADVPRPRWRSTFVGWVAAMPIVAGAFALVGKSVGIPAYVGGLFGFVLTGMIGTFALAARVARGRATER
ncbi:MAG: hypothetical protein ACKO5K_10850 [Armatimonadota bacterium]